jgi:hypothetical protein
VWSHWILRSLVVLTGDKFHFHRQRWILPTRPYDSHSITLTVLDPFGFVDSCFANVTVFDREPLVEDAIECCTDAVMSRCDESAESYIKSNGCPVQTKVNVAERRFCNRAGRTITKDTKRYLSTNVTTLFCGIMRQSRMIQSLAPIRPREPPSLVVLNQDYLTTARH